MIGTTTSKEKEKEKKKKKRKKKKTILNAVNSQYRGSKNSNKIMKNKLKTRIKKINKQENEGRLLTYEP